MYKNVFESLKFRCHKSSHFLLFPINKMLWQNCSYSEQQKHESSCLLSDCLLCISPELLEVQKSYLHLFASSSEELSDEIRIFQIW